MGAANVYIVALTMTAGLDRRGVANLTILGNAAAMERILGGRFHILETAWSRLIGLRSLRIARVCKLGNHALVSGCE
jgi:hypothetical protein